MRNIKRVLSLALASVMLLGMMVVGSSAAFNDADKIVNTKAATITAGLGLFAGTTDGNFDPTGTVTRAQMATVIAKMIYGSEVNADSFKGTGKFSDTASFEGGWAEGYINLCVNLGVVSGYGDGTFRPGNAVTTAEAVTMLINALKVDAGEGTWPMTVMAAAETIKLFNLEEELAKKPATNAALTRDELAVMTWNALNYSAEGNNVYVVSNDTKEYEFSNATDAHYFMLSNQGYALSVQAAEDALVSATFDLKTLTGYITANQATGAECTTVTDYANDKDADVALETGLDAIGHYVTVYFAEEYFNEDEPGIAYCIVDEAEYVVVDKEIEEDRKAFNAAFGSKALTASETIGANTDYTYVVTEGDADISGYNYTDKSAAVGTYVVYEGEFIGFIEPASKEVVEVQKITTKVGNESIRVGGTTYPNTEDNDKIVEYEGIAVDDIAVMVDAQGVKYLTKATQMNGEISRFGKDADGNDVITVDGKAYGFADYSGLDSDDFNFDITYTFFMDGDKVIAFEELEGSVDLGNIVYIVGTYTTRTTDAYGNEITSAYAQVVDMEGKESALLIGIAYANEAMTDLGALSDEIVFENEEDEVGEYVVTLDFNYSGFLVFEDDKTSSDTKKAGIKKVDEDAVKLAPEADKVTLFADTVTGQGFDSKTDKVTTGTAGLTFLSENTKFILVNGAQGKALEVSVKTGLANLAASYENDEEEEVDYVYEVLSVSDKAGNVTLEVVVFVEDEMALASDEVIYVSAAQIAAQSEVADATEIEVYFLKTNKFETIKVESAFGTGDAGFYTYTYDAAEGVYTDMAEYTTDVSFGETLKGLYGGNKLITVSENFDGNDASDAIVIDTRSKKDLEKSDFAKVEDLKDLADLIDSDIHVIMDVIIDSDDVKEPVSYIFVLDVAEHDFDLDNNENGTHDGECACGVSFVNAECEFDAETGECACGAVAEEEEEEEEA